MKRQSGFSLIELMVTLAIAGVLLAYAIPNLREFYLRQNMDARTNDLLVDLVFARAEAINRGESVTLTANTNWKDGWAVTDKDDVILRQSNFTEINVTFTDSEASENVAIIFQATGSLNSAAIRIINFDHTELVYSKTLTIALSGNASVRTL